MDKNTKYEMGTKLGSEAFKAGKKAVPAHDPRVMALIAGTEVGSVLELLKGWNYGWHTENVAVEVTPLTPGRREEIVDSIALALQDLVEDKVADFMNDEEDLGQMFGDESDDLPDIHGEIMDRLATKLKGGE